MKKVLLITNIPTPYRIPLFNRLHERLKEDGISLKIVFAAMGYERRKWEIDASDFHFNYELLPSFNLYASEGEKASFTYRGLYRILRREKPSLIITNGFSLATAKLWARSLFVSTPYVIWSGAVRRRHATQTLLKLFYRANLVKRAVGCIAYGSKAKEYLQSLGESSERIEIAINTVDTGYFMSQTREYAMQHHEPNGKKRVLYIGYLSHRKNVKKILRVVDYMKTKRSDFVLDIVGDGEDRSGLELFVKENDLCEFVQFHGYKQAQDLVGFLARADCFLFQTDFDIWGLVLVEAMAAGVPCISSIHAGATHDLIQDGETGFAVDFSMTSSVTDKVLWLLENPESASEMGMKGQRFISEHVTIEHSVAGFQRAILKALELPQRQMTREGQAANEGISA